MDLAQLLESVVAQWESNPLTDHYLHQGVALGPEIQLPYRVDHRAVPVAHAADMGAADARPLGDFHVLDAGG